jgi:hypothetical protein
MHGGQRGKVIPSSSAWKWNHVENGDIGWRGTRSVAIDEAFRLTRLPEGYSFGA